MSGLHQLRSCRVGLALSGGSVRGLAHIGVAKALSDHGIKPIIVTGTSVGSLVGAALAAGMNWQEVAALARNIFWPKLLHGETLERFCAEYLPKTFTDLVIPFVAIATELPAKRVVAITEGNLASAISASCALRGIRKPVRRLGKRLKDGGISCVLPSLACRSLGAEFIVGSDVWEISSLLNRIGIGPDHQWASRTYPLHYHVALQNTDLLIRPDIPCSGYLASSQALERMISAGDHATRQALGRLFAQAA
jgi:NTE family protein